MANPGSAPVTDGAQYLVVLTPLGPPQGGSATITWTYSPGYGLTTVSEGVI